MSDNKDNKGENINPDENITKKSDRCCFEGEEEYEKCREQYIKSLTGEHYDIKDYYVGDNKCVVINRNLSDFKNEKEYDAWRRQYIANGKYFRFPNQVHYSQPRKKLNDYSGGTGTTGSYDYDIISALSTTLGIFSIFLGFAGVLGLIAAVTGIILAIVSFFRKSGVALAIVGFICSIAGICLSVNTMSSGLGALLTFALLL